HGIKPCYFSKVMQKLVVAGLVRSFEGRAGGLALAKPAEDITVLQIALTLEEDQDFFRCTELRQQGPCAAPASQYQKPCNIARLMHQADAEWRRVLAKTSLSDLRRSVLDNRVPGITEATEAWLAEPGALRWE
ncbi:MAG: Rrf2 family transcriptional regulator, partial [Donghicola eburneus]